MDFKKFTGLNSSQALLKLKQFGKNEIIDTSKVTPFQILLRQIKNNFVIYLLIIAVIISFAVGKDLTSYTLLGVIFMVIFFGFIQEYRAEEAIKSLKQMLLPTSTVIRNGKKTVINSSEIVPEDILILSNGEKIPADCIIIESNSLKVNESVLTGESAEVDKFPIDKNNKAEEDFNKLYMGTFIVAGKAIAKVTHTGMNTKFGEIAHLISGADKELLLQQKVNQIAKKMVVIAIGISILTGLTIALRAENLDNTILVEILILVLALAVSAFPEGFPVVLISTLAVGARRMAQKNALVNRMSIIETLGEVTIICSDKTGTITKGEMAAKKIATFRQNYEVSGSGYNSKGKITHDFKEIDASNNLDVYQLIKSGIICNDSEIKVSNSKSSQNFGTPTELALKYLGLKAQISVEDFEITRLNEIPFDSSKKFMSVLVKENKQKIVYTKGAPEKILKMCNFVYKNGKPVKITRHDIEILKEKNKSFEKEGLRVLALAFQKIDPATSEIKNDSLVFLGFIGIEDAPREEVFEAIKQTKKSGIKVVMITGDSLETATSIAKQVGIVGKSVTGADLDNLTDKELSSMTEEIGIYARVTPEHKIRLVRIFKNQKHIVAMTGDGVNDAPALKEAHVGIAMGKNGTDVSRSASDLILRDDNFATIVTAIGEGRAIFNNIRKFVSLQLSLNVAELLILFIGVLLAPTFGWGVPILASIQILFINLITDNLSALTLGLNPTSPDIYEQKPRANQNIINKEIFKLISVTSLMMMFLTLGSYNISINFFGHTSNEAQTVALFTLILVEIATAFSFRSFRKYVIGRSIFINPYLFLTSIISICLTLIVIYTPLNKYLETTPLSIDIALIPVFGLGIAIVLNDIIKFINLRRNSYISELR